MAEMVILRLEGVLQSWGEEAKWNYRTTATFPSKSAIVGLIGAAMGIQRGDEYLKVLSDKICIGIRADRSGIIIEDFQTTTGMPELFTANHAKRGKDSNTILNPHYYLNDASFLVVLETDEKTAEAIANAFANPVWPAYLGRKNCVPSTPVFVALKEFPDILSALKSFPIAGRADKKIQFEIEEPMDKCTSYTRADLIAGNREFARRRVWRGTLEGNDYVSDKN